MILSIEPSRSPSPRVRGTERIRPPQLFLALPSAPPLEAMFEWPSWLSPSEETQDSPRIQLIPLASTQSRSRTK